MFDSHCHLNDEVFDETITEVIAKAREGGVNYFLIPGVDIESSLKSVKICEIYKNCFASVGVHPTVDLEKLDIDQCSFKLSEMLERNCTLALGETGLDYYKYSSSSEIQKKFFVMHIKLAIKHGKSLIVHNRLATEDVIKILDENWHNDLHERVIFHCAQVDDNRLIEYALKKGIYLGVDGDITFNKRKYAALKNISLDTILVETDSPFLLPEPLRSEKHSIINKPENIVLIAKRIAEIKDVSFEKVIEATTKNAFKAFLTK
jgi:TatD DNase family protein